MILLGPDELINEMDPPSDCDWLLINEQFSTKMAPLPTIAAPVNPLRSLNTLLNTLTVPPELTRMADSMEDAAELKIFMPYKERVAPV